MSPRTRTRFRVTLVVRSPFMFRASLGAQLGVDASCLRDEVGDLVIPADQVRGVVRDALVRLAAVGGGIRQEEIDAIFGGESKEASDVARNEPNRGTIAFTDLTNVQGPSAEDKFQSGEITRIEIDDATGAVKTGASLVVELAAPLGAEAAFSGEILLYYHAEPEGFQAILLTALTVPLSIGSYKSSGFGEIVAGRTRVELIRDEPKLSVRKSERRPERLRYRVTFDRPLLVDTDRIADNVFVGSEIIPGSVFKGALATKLTFADLDPQSGTLGEAMSMLSLGHAHPESTDRDQPASLALPLSLAAAKDASGELRFADALEIPEGRGIMIGKEVGVFSIDWKNGWAEEARRRLKLSDYEPIPKLPRTHTRIVNGVAVDQLLYTTVSLAPRRRSGEKVAWRLDVDVGAVSQKYPAEADRLLRALESGLDFIGKTQASASFEYLCESPPPSASSFEGRVGVYAIVLQSDALLFDFGEKPWPATPKEAYEAYFAEALPGAKLVNFFARQRLSGGYLARRRRAHPAYYPFVLTKAGSVFLVDGAPEDKLADALRYGLPQPRREREPFTWRNCPFVRENGYGRITADYRCRSYENIEAGRHA